MAECARQAAHQQRPTELHRPSQPTEPGLDHVSSRPGGCCDAQTPKIWHLQAQHTFTFVGIWVQQCSKATLASSRCRRASSSAWAYRGAMLGLKL